MVRFAALNAVSAFSYKVIDARTTPYPHIHIVIPPKIESVEVRLAIRVNLGHSVTVVNEATESKPVTMMITDLSPIGARIEGQVEIADKGDVVSITMQLQISEKDYTVSVSGKDVAKGITSRTDHESGEEIQSGLNFGLKFEAIDTEDYMPLFIMRC